MKQAHVIISGFVQGVGFRQFVKHNASRLSITGWVQNTKDGNVEAVFQSSKQADIEMIIAFCHKGPFLSEVKNVVVTWEQGNEQFTEFVTRVSDY